MKHPLVVLTILFTSLISAQNNNMVYIWPNKVPLEIKPKKTSVISENTQGNVIRIAEVTNPSLTIYQPKKSNASKAGIIICPGGGYNILAFDKEGTEIANWLNSLGYTAFVLQYRVPKNRTGAMQDVQRAIKWVRSKAKDFDLNSEKIGLMGFSAGGHLTANASINPKQSYKSIDEIDKNSSVPNFSMLIYPAYLDKGENRTLSPELRFKTTTSLPPFFVFGTIDDPYGNSPLTFTTALRDANKTITLHVLPKGGHGYGLRKGNIAAKTWPSLLKHWLENVVQTNK